MHRPLSVLFVALVACSSTAGIETGIPAGPERLSLSRGALELAPGRDAWLTVSTFIQTSSSSLESVPPSVTFESSNPSVVTVALDSVQYGHVVAKSVGSATITVRSKRDSKNVARTVVTVKEAPVSNDAGLVYSATAALVPTSTRPVNTPLGPSEIAVNVTVSNPTTQTRDVLLAGCSAWIRIYATATYNNPPIVDLPRNVECSVDARRLTLGPGQSENLQAEGFRLTLSGEATPPGRYYIAAAVDRVRDLLDVRAGPLEIVSPNAGLTFAASVAVSGGQLRPRVSITNTNSAAVRLEYGACSVSLLAFRTADRTGTPAWNSDARRGPGGFGYACPAYLAIGTIGPGQTTSPREFNPTFAVAEMLGDSLPAGRYYFSARTGLNWRTQTVPAGDAEVTR